MADEELHEIHLKSKQLVALFMTAAVLLVVTFLCGVLVGRGVRARKEPVLAAAAVAPAPAEDPTLAAALQSAPNPPSQGQATPPTTPPPQAEEDVNYLSRLEGQTPPADSVRTDPGAARAAAASTPAQPAARPAPVPAPAPAAKTASPAAKAPAPAAKTGAAAPVASSDPAGSGYVVKIVAYRDKAQSSALAARLAGKGYPAYVVTVTGKGVPLYSVRVGKFKTRQDAEAAKQRLEKEEQFQPLITR